MKSASYSTPGPVSAGLAILRIAVGFVFIAHGAQKLFVMGLPAVTGMLTNVGVPRPEIAAVVLTAAELVGGAALVLGLLTRLAAFALTVDMATAVALVRIQGGFFAPKGAELELTLLAASLALWVAGPGAFSLDYALRGRPRTVVSREPSETLAHTLPAL